jgi:ketosteroid isomerase-like protein
VEHVDAKVGGRDIQSELRATNIYRREGNAWKMVHHHTDADRGIQEAAGLA